MNPARLFIEPLDSNERIDGLNHVISKNPVSYDKSQV